MGLRWRGCFAAWRTSSRCRYTILSSDSWASHVRNFRRAALAVARMTRVKQLMRRYQIEAVLILERGVLAIAQLLGLVTRSSRAYSISVLLG